MKSPNVFVLKMINETLDGLKDFQRATVDQVLSLYSQEDHHKRVLIADEVGLGKTLVAKGVIARLLTDWNEKRPLRVAYICSNLTLADENRQKLSIFSGSAREKYVKEPSFSRLAELGLVDSVEANSEHIIEICTLTPATSFSITQGLGNMRERAILLHALMTHEKLVEYKLVLDSIFKNAVSDTSWAQQNEWILTRSWNKRILNEFHKRLSESSNSVFKETGVLKNKSWLELITRYSESVLCDSSFHNEINSSIIIRNIRIIFVQCCASYLEADLFILDEFQNFKEIIEKGNETEQSYISSQVFRKDSQHKVLLLSATPFKAMTSLDEDENDEAHLKGLRTVMNFLRDGASLQQYESARRELHSELLRLTSGIEVIHLSDVPRKKVENELRPIICRTERAQISSGVDEVMQPVILDCSEEYSDQDIKAFVALDQIATTLRTKKLSSLSSQAMEFSKSAAWPLSFSGGYTIKRIIDNTHNEPDVDVVLRRGKPLLWMNKNKIQKYSLSITNDSPNAKVRALVKRLLTPSNCCRADLLLWVPPSLPHYKPSGFFENSDSFSKTLIFSSWTMVPRMLSSLISYEVERRSLGSNRKQVKYFSKTVKRHGQILSFDGGSSLANWAFVYPSRSLALFPLARENRTLDEVISERSSHFSLMLDKLKHRESKGRPTENWYALAPILLDGLNHPEWRDGWLEEQDSILSKEGKSSGKYKRFEALRGLASNDCVIPLGPMPDDLADFIALLSIASPAICALRALETQWGSVPPDELRSYSTSIAFAFETLFNGEAAGVINAMPKRGKPKKSWHKALQYCADGGMQAMLDEYVHMLNSAGFSISEAVTRMSSAISIHPSSTTVYTSAGESTEIQKPEFEMRCHYAVSLGTQSMSAEKGQGRVSNIREAFNSPFRPFVLTSTSIGQEGLDFHWYCGEVVHWNLPHNPIDLEQREGRINRFKSLVIRRRAVEAVAPMLEKLDGWDQVFSYSRNLPNQTELTPFWHIPGGSQHLKRIIPMLPLSREVFRYDAILKILSLYRLAFGQPRQEELLGNLLNLELSDEDSELLKKRLMINLAPVLYEHHLV